jgi:hypothetical protein
VQPTFQSIRRDREGSARVVLVSRARKARGSGEQSARGATAALGGSPAQRAPRR